MAESTLIIHKVVQIRLLKLLMKLTAKQIDVFCMIAFTEL